MTTEAVMTNSAVQRVLAQKAQLAAAVQMEQAEAMHAHNQRYAAAAWQTLDYLLGDMKAELMPYIYSAGHIKNKDGFWTGVEWRIKSDELMLAPIEVSFSLRSHYAGEGSAEELGAEVSCKVDNGAAGQSWYRVTRDVFADVLWAANQAYPAWKAKEDEKERQKQLRAEEERRGQINTLCYKWAWTSYNNSEKDVLERYEQLKALDPAVAEEQLAFYRQDAQDRAEQQMLKHRKLEAAKVVWDEYDRLYAEWEEACRQWMEREQARLWQPWTLWKTRYVPFRVIVTEDEEVDFSETIYTLDAPEDIVKQSPVPRVDKVDAFGKVKADFAIGAFLDAEPIHYEEPRGAYHRSFYAYLSTDDFVVHVPPFVTEDPVPAPVKPVAPDCERPAKIEF